MKSMTSFLSGISAVVLIANQKLAGAPIITPSLDANDVPKVDNNGNELGSIRLQQEVVTLTGTFINARPRTAFLSGTIEQLERLVKLYNLKDGSQIPGKIVQIESLKPMWKGHNPKVNPSTGAQVEIDVNGTLYPVFMQQRYSEDANASDVLIRTASDVMNILDSERAASTGATVVANEEAGVPKP